MTEPDWRRFKHMVPELRERYLAALNARIVAKLTHPAKTETDRFWDAADLIKREGRVLQQCLDGHSRSRMYLFMGTMVQAGMLQSEDITLFSEDLQRKLSHLFEKRKG